MIKEELIILSKKLGVKDLHTGTDEYKNYIIIITFHNGSIFKKIYPKEFIYKPVLDLVSNELEKIYFSQRRDKIIKLKNNIKNNGH